MCVKCWWSGSLGSSGALRVLRTKYSAIFGLFSSTSNNGRRAGRGKVSKRLSCEDARNTGSSERWYAERYCWIAWPNEVSPAKNGVKHFATIEQLRSTSDIAFLTN